MDDFAEIEPAGFRLQFTPHKGGGCVVEIEPGGHGQGLPITGCVRTLPVIVNGSGTVIECPSGWNSPYRETHPTYLVSDRDGMFGRRCPRCRCYFRTSSVLSRLFCPYCAHQADNGAYTTENQSRFMYLCCKAVADAALRGVKSVFDLGEAAKQLPSNRPAWVYSEQSQQNRFSCKPCNVMFDILGEYGNCPSCGKRNYKLVFEKKMQVLGHRFAEADSKVQDRHRREEEWRDLLVRCVSEFESLANDCRRQLLRIPCTKKRKEDLTDLSFQHILKAHDSLKQWYDIGVLDGLAEDEKIFLNRIFNRRHLLVHTGGAVDQDYLDRTSDTTVKLNQVIRIRSAEIRRLIDLCRRAGGNLITGYESID